MSALATLDFDVDQNRPFGLPAKGTPSLLYVFGPDHTLGARAYSGTDEDFTPGTSQSNVRLDFWADSPWTEVVRAGARFVIWYGGEVGHGAIERIV